MLDAKKVEHYLQKLLLIIVIFYPFTIIFRSVAINLATVILSIVFLYYINTKEKNNIF